MEVIRIASLYFGAASFVCLLQFGLRIIFPKYSKNKFIRRTALIASLLFLVAVTWYGAVSGFSDPWLLLSQILMRYLLGFPGATLTAIGFWRQRKLSEIQGFSFDHMDRSLMGMATVFALYAFFAGLIVPAAPFFLASVLNYATFQEAAGIPVQFIRAACALLAAYFITSILNIFNLESEGRLAKANAELKQSNGQLETRVQERTLALTEALQGALVASNAKSEFLSSMSHEIRTPMNAILGMAQLLDETPLSPEQKKYLEIMINNGDSLLDLINGILDLAKIESGQLALEQASFNLETLVDRTIETLSVRAHQKGLEMLAHVMPDVPTRLFGDRLRTGQVLLNLIGNAIKFTQQGQVLLTVERDHASGNPGHLHFSVADSGIGIAKDKLEEVFANFTQADSSTSRHYGGSGLGLAIVRRLVDLMGGRVWVESELGHGSVFHFTAQFQAQTDASAERPPTVLLSGMRTLVVDDNATNRLILRQMLASRGAEVDEACDGATALELIARAHTSGMPYKLMLLDCRMPGMDGFEVAERLKARGEHSLTVLMLSSDDLKADVARAHKVGLDAYLVKPVRRRDLFNAIGTAMASHTARAAAAVRPPRPAAAEAAAPGPMPDAPPELPLNILLADDSPDNRLLIHAFLEKAGHRLDDAENGAIAAAMFKAGNYDLVLMDVQMPVMDGLAATRAIRAWERERGLSRTQVLVLTASALDEDVGRALEAGADLHISKPIKKAALIAAIKNFTSSPSILTIVKNLDDAAA
jgi:signal transduction histidine kinase/CheY-like chemotaxis protein